MANTFPFDPGTSEARSSWLAGLTEAMSIVTQQLDLKADEEPVEITLTELFIDEEDRYRIYQADEWNKLWLTDPKPTFTKNGETITPEDNGFTIDYLGGSIAFDDLNRPQDDVEIKATVRHILGGTASDRSNVLTEIKNQLEINNSNLEKKADTETVEQRFSEIESSIQSANVRIDKKQDELQFDETPQDESTNPVTSQGIKSYVDEAVSNVKIDMDEVPTENSENAVKSGGVWDGLQRKPNKNLLHNWYFGYPVNQMDQMEYTGARYTVDRWRNSRTGKITVGSDCIIAEATPDSNGIYLNQSIEDPESLRGKTLTASFLYSFVNDDKRAKWNFVLLGKTSTTLAVKDADGAIALATVTKRIEDDATSVRVAVINTIGTVYDGYPPINIYAAKLELGPAQTLAHKEGDQWVLNDPPPNYQQELAKCQRYQVVLGDANNGLAFLGVGLGYSETTANVIINLPQTMRAKPVPTISGRFALQDANTSFDISSISANTITENGVSVSVLSKALTKGTTYFLRQMSEPTAKIILDANL